MKIKKRVFRGWMDVKDKTEIPQGKGNRERNCIVWGCCKWFDDSPSEKWVKITVEWREK